MQDHDRRSIGVAIAEAWRRRKWLGLVCFSLPAAAMLSLAMNLPNLYSSTATVLVEQQQIPEGFVKSSVTGEADARLNLRQDLGQRQVGDNEDLHIVRPEPAVVEPHEVVAGEGGDRRSLAEVGGGVGMVLATDTLVLFNGLAHVTNPFLIA